MPQRPAISKQDPKAAIPGNHINRSKEVPCGAGSYTLEYRPDEAVGVPVSIRPSQTKGVWRDFLPGVRLQPYGGPLRDLMERMDTKLPPQAHSVVSRSHILLIRPTRYLAGVRKRIQAEGGAVPKGAVEMVLPSFVARQCLMAAILTTRSRFAVASSYSLRQRDRGWVLTGFSNQRLEETSLHVFSSLRSKPLDLEDAKRLMVKLDRYYRAITWWTDRVGMALGYLWEGLCATYPAQTYISLIALVDSLVGTRQSGGHALAERVATMLGTDPQSRKAEYDEMKSLYGVRNRLVHGSAHPRKGRSLYMGAKCSNIPYDDLSRLLSLCVRLIRSSLEDKEYLSLVQTEGKEDKINKQLDTLFLNRLLGAS